MPNYQAYPTNKNSSRKQRKGMRNSVFIANRKLRKKVIKRAERNVR